MHLSKGSNMLSLLDKTQARVTFSDGSETHAIALELEHGQEFDPSLISVCYGPQFQILSIEVFPPETRYTLTAVFASLFDCDPETGEPETRYVRLLADRKPTKSELSQLKAANTGYRLIDLWIGDSTIEPEF